MNKRKTISLVIFLHFYQPPNQQQDILARIVFESYQPILQIFQDNPRARATFNFPAGLAELLIKNGYSDVVKKLRILVQRGQIELTGSAAYHAFLPLLPISEIKRQILLNEQGLNKFFGKTGSAKEQYRGTYKRKGFFPPELAFSEKVARIVVQLGYQWMAIPMISLGSKIADFTTLYKLSGENLYLFARNKWASAVILSGAVRTKNSFLEWLSDERPREYILTIMDGETFGHHRPGLDNLLAEIVGAAEFELLQVSDLMNRISQVREVKPRESCWSNEEQDFWIDGQRKTAAKNPFLLWSDLANPIHKLQWQLTGLAIRTVNMKTGLKARTMLDQALSSDQYWWASAKPWWSLEMIEAGAWNLFCVIQKVAPNSKILDKAEKIYQQILAQAFFWQRTGFIRKMHKQLSATTQMPAFGKRAPAEWYNQIILEFEDEMRKAAAQLEFEKAIKWRDAIFKLNTGADVFDVLHIVDELHACRKIPSVKPFLLHKNSEISEFSKKFLQVVSPKEIKAGKERLRQQGYKIENLK